MLVAAADPFTKRSPRPGPEMLRIKTVIGSQRVFTMEYLGKWITLYTIHGRSESMDAANLLEGGRNHLLACQKVQETNESGSLRTRELLQGRGHREHVPRGVSNGDVRTHPEGLDGDGGSGRTEALPSDSSSEDHQGSHTLDSTESKLTGE